MPDAVNGINNSHRRPHKKVKTGCATCKIRRVKCDEARPHCLRCLNSGRRCDGYASVDQNAVAADPAESILDVVRLSMFGGHHQTQLEGRFMNFFHVRTVPLLIGPYDSGAWSRLLLQLSQTEPALRHAMIALSSFHETSEIRNLRSDHPACNHSDTSSGYDGDETKTEAFALHQYTQAVRLLRVRLAAGEQSTIMTLVSCVLFICLEFLRGNNETAITHLESGLKIVRAQQQQARRNLLTDRDVPADVTRHALAPLFSRLCLLQSLYGQPRSRMFAEILDVDLEHLGLFSKTKFASMEEAGIAATNVMNSAIRFAHCAVLNKFPDQIAAFQEQIRLTGRLRRWQEAFDAYTSARSISPDSNDPDVLGLKIIQTFHTMTSLWVETMLIQKETAFDKYIPQFDEMMKLMECIINYHRNVKAGQDLPASFTMDLGIIPNLFWTAIKCRDSLIRRKALALMHRGPRREGLWHATTVSKLAELIINLEETSMQSDPSLTVPPERARIHDINVVDRDPADSDRQLVILKWKPNGLDADWHYREEYIYY